MRTKVHGEKKIKEKLDMLGVEHYIPFRVETREWSDRKKKVEVPLIPGMAFIRESDSEALRLANELGVEITFIYDKSTRKRMIVPDRQMKDFIFVTDMTTDNPEMKIYDDKLRPGTRVRVVKGEFSGIEGELIRVQGHKRVVIRLPGLLSIATTYVPGEYLEVIE